MDFIIILLNIIFALFLSVCIHEMAHYIIFKIYKIRVISIGIFFIHVINKKIIFKLLSPYSFGGYNLIDTSFIISNQAKIGFFKRLMINHIITVLVSTSICILSCVYLLQGEYSTFLITTAVVNALIVMNAFYSELGDIRLLRSISQNNIAGYLYMTSSEALTRFKNKYLYEIVIDYLKTLNVNELSMNQKLCLLGLINYVIDYSLYHHICVNDYIESNINNFKRIKGIGEYIFYKLQLIEVIHGQFKIVDLINNSELSNGYKDNLDNFIKKLNGGKDTSYLDLKLEKKYGLFRNDVNVIKLLENIYNDLIKII